MAAKFYVISLGPGDPEMITIKALRAFMDCDAIFVPTRSLAGEWKGSIAYNIIKKIAETHKDWFSKPCDSLAFINNWDTKLKPIYTPMSYSSESWKDQVGLIAEACNSLSKVGFVTLGDAALYSSAYYLLEIIKKNYSDIYENVEVIPGITSISYASSLVKRPLCLGNSSLEIVPMHSDESGKTKVYMRLHKGDDVSHIDNENVYFFENIGLDNGKYGKGTPGIIKNYLTVLVDFADYNEPSLRQEKK